MLRLMLQIYIRDRESFILFLYFSPEKPAQNKVCNWMGREGAADYDQEYAYNNWYIDM